MRRLSPSRRDQVDEQLDGWAWERGPHADRPYLVPNFATTLDGRAAIDGRSGSIGSEADTEMLRGCAPASMR